MTNLRVLRARERAKRLFVLGAVVLFYSGSWLFFAWHASRTAETECTITRDAYGCSVTHAAVDYEVGLLPNDRDCNHPKYIPSPGGAPLVVGAKLRCFYYLAAPDRVRFEPVHHVWLTPGRAAFFGAGLAIVAFGVVVLVMGRRPTEPAAAPAAPVNPVGPYREPGTVPPPSRPEPAPAATLPPPLAIRLSRSSGCAWILVGPIFVLSSIAGLMAGYVVAWDHGGDFEAGQLIFTCLVHPFWIGSAFVLFYRSEVVLDAERGLVWHAWGVFRPWLRAYWPLATLERAVVHTSSAGRGRSIYLRLVFEGGATRDYGAGHEVAADAAARIEAYLQSLRAAPGADAMAAPLG